MNLYERLGRLTLIVIGLLIVVPIGVAVVWSIVADASMLTDAMGWWGLAAFLVVPVAVAIYAIRNR